MYSSRSSKLNTVFCLVLYAPYVGALGLDMARKCTREDALRGQEDINLDINHPIPVYPETVAFNVCEIRKGNKTFCFLQDDSSL